MSNEPHDRIPGDPAPSDDEPTQPLTSASADLESDRSLPLEDAEAPSSTSDPAEPVASHQDDTADRPVIALSTDDATPAEPAGPHGEEPPDPSPSPAADPEPAPLAATGTAATGSAATGTEAATTTPRDRRTGSRLGLLIPLIAVLALLFGLGGGYLGALLQDRVAADDAESDFDVDGRGVSTDAPLDADNDSVETVAAELLPSTVQVFATGADDATGSGFVMDTKGHIITNNHVIADAVEAGDDGSVEVQGTDGTRFEVEVVGTSAVYDIAVLYAEEAKELQPVSFGASDDLEVGQPVVAIGSPLGLAATVTSGIVSAKNRPVTTGNSADDASYINAVQTDAAINPGNSGGPLVNLAGQVVGVNSAIATTGGIAGSGGSIGVGFAIPSEQVLRTAGEIIDTGEATYPVIGAQVQVGGEETGEGALIEEVNPDSPAEAGGLQDGDIVTGVDDTLITSGEQFIVALRSRAPGDEVELKVDRDGEEVTVQVTLAEQVG